MRNLMFILFSSSLYVTINAQQVGPGGVGDNGTIAVWLDAGELLLSDNDPVGLWQDVSGNGNDFTQVGSLRPTFLMSSIPMNNRPSVSFSNDYIVANGLTSLNTNTLSWFTATNNSSNSLQVILRSSYASGAGAGSGTLWGTYLSGAFRPHTRGSSATMRGINTGFASGTNIVSGVWDGSVMRGFRNGRFFSAKGGANANPTGHIRTVLGASSNPINTYFNGEIGELIIYSTNINDAQRIIVDNYLCTKYGRTMIQNDKYAHDSDYGEELAGIGREDATNEHLSAKGKGIVEITAVSLDDEDYLLWGHDGADLLAIDVGTPPVYSTFSPPGKRFERLWRVTETQEVGDVTIVFDLSSDGFGDTSTYELLLDTDNSGIFDDDERYAGIYSGSSISFSVLSADLEDGNLFTLANTEGQIISIVDGQDWNDPSTWNCNCIPKLADNVLIDAAHTVTVSDPQNVLDLDVDVTGALALDASAVFDVYGDLDCLGGNSFSTGSRLRFLGGSAQTVSFIGTVDLDNMTIDNSSGVTLTSGIYSITGLLRPDQGVLDVNGVTLTLKSDATATARVGIMIGASIVGDVVVERFVQGGNAGYRDMTVPFASGFVLDEWDDELFISGPDPTFDDGCAYWGNGCEKSAKFWNASSQSYDGYARLDSVSTPDGALEIFLGTTETTLSSVVIDGDGVLNTAAQFITCKPSWNLIGNPFACPVDFDNVNIGANIGNYFYVWDTDIDGFQYWDGGLQTATDTRLSGGVISSGQGIWVNNTSATDRTLIFPQISKDTVSSDNFLKSQELKLPEGFITMTLASLKGKAKCIAGIKYDQSSLQYGASDIPHMSGIHRGGVGVYSLSSDGYKLRVNSISEWNDLDNLPLYVEFSEIGNYKLAFNNLPENLTLYIEDHVTGLTHCLNRSSEFEFYNDILQTANHRFTVHIEKSSECEPLDDVLIDHISVNYTTDNLNIWFDEAPSEAFMFELINGLGQIIYTSPTYGEDVVKVEQSVVLKGSGIYFVKIKSITDQVIAVEKLVNH